MSSRTIGSTNYPYYYTDTAHIDAPTNYRGNSYSYDANGNQITGTVNGTSQSRTYDEENRLSSVVTGTTTLSFIYDANGKRLIQSVVSGGGSIVRTLYIGNLYEESLGSSTYICYYYLAGKMVGMRRVNQTTGNGQYRLVGDHRGSTPLRPPWRVLFVVGPRA